MRLPEVSGISIQDRHQVHGGRLTWDGQNERWVTGIKEDFDTGALHSDWTIENQDAGITVNSVSGTGLVIAGPQTPEGNAELTIPLLGHHYFIDVHLDLTRVAGSFVDIGVTNTHTPDFVWEVGLGVKPPSFGGPTVQWHYLTNYWDRDGDSGGDPSMWLRVVREERGMRSAVKWGSSSLDPVTSLYDEATNYTSDDESPIDSPPKFYIKARNHSSCGGDWEATVTGLRIAYI